MKKITILLMAFLFLSCHNDSFKEENVNYALYTYITFGLYDNRGNDLLDPNTNNTYNNENIKIYFLLDGIKTLVYNPDLNYSKGYKITHSNSKYGISLFSNAYNEFDNITYIEWNETETDTIRANFKVGANFKYLDKFWYNNELMYEDDHYIKQIIIK